MNTSKLKSYLLLIFVVAAVAYWFVPIKGSIIISGENNEPGVWPKFDVNPSMQTPGSSIEITVRDVDAWSYVELTVSDAIAVPVGNPVEPAFFNHNEKDFNLLPFKTLVDDICNPSPVLPPLKIFLSEPPASRF